MLLLPPRATDEQNGTLESGEVTDALKGMFPVDPADLERVVRSNWSHWDTDRSGVIGDVH